METLGEFHRRNGGGDAFEPSPARVPPAATEQTIVDELLAVQGQPADIGGYYAPNAANRRHLTIITPGVRPQA